MPSAGNQASHPPAGLRAIAVAASPDPVAYSHGSIWVGHYGPDIVERINPGTGRVIARVRTGGSPIWIEGDRRWVWVANYDSATVSRINPRGCAEQHTWASAPRQLASAVASGST